MKNMLLATTSVLALCLSPGFASADEYGQAETQSGGGYASANANMTMGEHSMGATVESVDHKTGFMKLKTGMGMMTIHFPAPAVKNLKKGDKITVNLSFTKDMKGDGMMMKK